jgi:polyhydroxyalkanoate synthase subunit PhaC
VIGEAVPAAALGPVETGATPRQVVWTRNKTTLYRYEPLAPREHATPVLLVYALINRPYILDLRPESSLVRTLLDRGYDVFLLDWGVPGWEDRGTTLDELVGDHLPRAVERMRRAGGGGDYTLLGYCMGGTMAAMHAAVRPEGLRNLVALTTPIDFSHAGIHALWTDPRHLDARALVDALGNVPASLIDLGNKMLRPVANFVEVHASMLDRLLAGRDMTSWRAMNQWVNDGIPFPGSAFVQWMEDHYQGNRLVRDELELDGRPVRLGTIEVPVLAIAGARDHIVPPAMARPLVERVRSDDAEYAEIPAGHVGMLVGSGARTMLWPLLLDWLDARSD